MLYMDEVANLIDKVIAAPRGVRCSTKLLQPQSFAHSVLCDVLCSPARCCMRLWRIGSLCVFFWVF